LPSCFEVHPKLRRRSERGGKISRRFGRNAALAEHDIVNQLLWTTDDFGELSLSPTARLEFISQKLSGGENFG
jgi:hypothetical protein